LLEIIGQGKDPKPINKHIKKIFEGINSIEHDGGTGKGPDRVYMIKKIKAADDEQIELDGELAVNTKNNVENWLMALIKSMWGALKRLFNKQY
jgi:dynein heavy chain 2